MFYVPVLMHLFIHVLTYVTVWTALIILNSLPSFCVCSVVLKIVFRDKCHFTRRVNHSSLALMGFIQLIFW